MKYAKLTDHKIFPKDLYYCGTYGPDALLNCVAIVGSRHMTTYGQQVIERMVPPLVLAGKTIVSGFMYGIDQYAHRICMDNGGKTIAVLGWGIDTPLEGEDQKLAHRIIDTGGLLISQWETQKPSLWTFPARNRIVVGLSQEIIIVEAAHKSGSLITAHIAIQMKRPLFAVPGPITSKTSEGANQLIADGLATMWLPTAPITREITSDPILKILTREPRTVSEIARELGESVAQVGARITMLTMQGFITQRGGKQYAR